MTGALGNRVRHPSLFPVAGWTRQVELSDAKLGQALWRLPRAVGFGRDGPRILFVRLDHALGFGQTWGGDGDGADEEVS